MSIVPATVIAHAQQWVGYHEKVRGTPDAYLSDLSNSYDSTDSEGNYTIFTKLCIDNMGYTGSQGDAWCGIFAYNMFCRACYYDRDVLDQVLYGLRQYAGVNGWYQAFPSSAIHTASSTYTPQVGDLIIYSSSGYNYAHIGIVADTSTYPQYGVFNTIEGNIHTNGMTDLCSRTKTGTYGGQYPHWFLTPNWGVTPKWEKAESSILPKWWLLSSGFVL